MGVSTVPPLRNLDQWLALLLATDVPQNKPQTLSALEFPI